MGAMNHKPTNRKITAVSAWLSQRIGEGFALTQEANNHLEDAIILGMGKLHVEDLAVSLSGSPADHLRQTITTLKRAESILPLIQSGYSRLAEAAEKEHYKGNPLASQLEKLRLKEAFEGIIVCPTINTQVWQELERRIRDENILKTLEWEAGQFQALVQPIQDFITVMEDCLRIAKNEGDTAFVNAVENNEIPVRQYGGQLFSLWNYLHAMFLYSAVIMTELFYRANAYPSLLTFDPVGSRIQTA